MGISTFLGKAPEYNKYCPSIATEKECIDAGGRWINNSYPPRAVGEKPIPAEGGYCEYSYTECQKELDDANRAHTRKIFFVALPLGIIIIALGAIIFGLESVGGGLMAGGVGIIIYGVQGFWQYADDWLKFVLSLAGLVVVIGLAYYANKRWWSKK